MQVWVREVSYLGCTIKEGMVHINEQRVQQLRQIERPHNVRELRRALGAFGYVQRWLPGLAQVARPLYSAITDQPYARLRWNTEMDEAFSTIKNMIADAVSLSLPDMEQPFTLVTDCSQLAAGAMLAQRSTKTPDLLKPIAFYHHALSKPEQGYSATEKELLAMVKAVMKFRVYLGKQFDLITDHHALHWLKSLNPENETGRRGRWLDLLQQFDMRVVHKKGKSPEMRIADYLSRVKCDGDVTGTPESEVFVVMAVDDGDNMVISRESILLEQGKDEAIRAVKSAIVTGRDLNPGNSESASWRKPSLIKGNEEVAAMWKHKDRLFVDVEGILRLRFNGGKRSTHNPYGTVERNRIIVPRDLKPEVMKLVHRSATASHMGNTRTWKRARDNFWWPSMRQEIEKYILNCGECGLNKHVNNPNKAPASKTSIPGKPLDEMMLDFLGPFQAARDHPFRYVLQMQDVFSRFIVFVPCTDCRAVTAAEALMGRWLCLFGMPKTIRSDRGTHFIAEVFEDLCTRVGIRQKLGSPEHAQSQGQVERQNQLLNQVRCLCENDVDKWPEALSKVQCSHNAAINATTGFSPARLLFGRNFNLPEDLIAEEQNERTGPAETVLEERDEETRLMVEQAMLNLEENQERRVEDATREGANTIPYKVGDVVRYKLNDDARSKKGGKIAPRYSEPYRVTEVKGDGYTYTLEALDRSSRGMRKDRRFDYLRTVERGLGQDTPAQPEPTPPGSPPQPSSGAQPVVSNQDTGEQATPSEFAADRLRRSRKPVVRLQIDGRRKQYEESEAGDTESKSE